MLSYVEILLFGGAAIVRGDHTHFTWWGVLLFVAALLSVSSEFRYRRRVLIASGATGIVILLAVNAMSVTGCKLLTTALGELGSWGYFAGNFALHYYPCLRSVHLLCSEAPGAPVPIDGALLLAAYCALNAPTTVYGCSFGNDGAVAAVGVAFCIAAHWLLGTWHANVKHTSRRTDRSHCLSP